MDTVGPVLASLLSATNLALLQAERPVDLVTLAPGNNVVWDNCCDGGGELWVRLISLLPQPQGSQPCDVHALSARIGVGVVRCMHGLSDEGSPTAEQMTDDTFAMTLDASVLLQAIRDWDSEAVRVRPKTISIEQGLPQGPAGFCGGFEWVLSLQVGVC